MRTISKRPLRDFWIEHPQCQTALKSWWRLIVGVDASDFAALRRVFPSADQVKVASGRVVTVFNVAGNKYRLIAQVIYEYRRVYVLRVMTHAEYSRQTWKDQL